LVFGIGDWFVGFAVVDFFIRFACGADAGFYFFDEPKDKTFLLFACPFAKGTFEALFSLLTLLLSGDFVLH